MGAAVWFVPEPAAVIVAEPPPVSVFVCVVE
jgi:hypothetical protein